MKATGRLNYASRRAVASMMLLCLACASAHARQLAVVSRADDLVARIDLKTETITHRIPVGNYPHEITAGPDLGTAVVSAYGGNTLTIVGLATGTVRRQLVLDGYDSLHSAAVMDGYIWVTAEEHGSVLQVEPDTGEIVNIYRTGGYRSHMVVAVPERSKLYVANIDSGSVSVIWPDSSHVKVIKTGAGAEGIDVSPDGDRVWVSNRSDNTITVLDTAVDTIVTTFSSGGDFPVKARFRPDGREVWIANNRSGTIAVFDADTFECRTLIEVGPRPLGISFSADSRLGYVSKPGEHSVIEINIGDDYAIERAIEVLPSPDGILWISEGG